MRISELGQIYGFDISKPAKDVKEAIQWTCWLCRFCKRPDGPAIVLNTPPPSWISAQRNIAQGTYTERQIQEFVDHFIMKLRLVKFARTPEYNELFSGNPTWVTESIGGVGIDGRRMVTKCPMTFIP